MAGRKFDKAVEKSILKALDSLARKFGLHEVRHAANRWTTGQRDKARLLKERVTLERKLAEVSKRLSR